MSTHPDRPEDTTGRTLTIPVPTFAPFGIECTAEMVQEVWDTFVKPDQDAGVPQSGEMRVLMAILRAVYVGLSAEADRG